MESGGGQRVVVIEHRFEINVMICNEIVVIKEVQGRNIRISLLLTRKSGN